MNILSATHLSTKISPYLCSQIIISIYLFVHLFIYMCIMYNCVSLYNCVNSFQINRVCRIVYCWIVFCIIVQVTNAKSSIQVFRMDSGSVGHAPVWKTALPPTVWAVAITIFSTEWYCFHCRSTSCSVRSAPMAGRDPCSITSNYHKIHSQWTGKIIWLYKRLHR